MNAPTCVCAFAAGQTGSFLNMAPEVVLNEPYDEKADIFSMGCCFFEVWCSQSTQTGFGQIARTHTVVICDSCSPVEGSSRKFMAHFGSRVL